jgi:hypothetical protein
MEDVRAAVENLAGQAGVGQGRVRVVFQTVTDVALLGTVVVSGALAAVHLYKALFPRHKEEHPGPETAGGDRLPPHRRGPHTTTAGGDRRRDEDEGVRSR